MKQLLTTSLILLTAYTNPLAAQTTPAQKPVKTGNEWKMPGDAIKRSKDFAASLQKNLGLDSTKTRKVFELFLGNTKSLDEISVANNSDREKALLRKKNQDAFNENIRGILTPGQFDQYIKLKLLKN